MKEHLFNTVDIVAVPVILLILTLIIFSMRKKQPLAIRKYFFPAFLLRVLGTFLISLITEFYYKTGDTYSFYYNVQALRGYCMKHPGAWLDLLFSNPLSSNESVTNYLSIIKEYSPYAESVFRTPENGNLCKIASVFNIFCFNSYLALALCFGLLSFLGCWYIYKTFVHIYPGYEKQFALLCLYLPSLWFWGSGVLKDPLCLFALGILFYSCFVKHAGLFKRLIVAILGAFLLITVKAYIFYAFAIAMVIAWGFYQFKKLSPFLKVVTVFVLIVALGISFSMLTDIITNSLNDIIKDSQRYLELSSQILEEGDSTSLPTLDPTPFGFFKFSMQGLLTVFIKPFPWQLSKPLYLFVILENLLIYYIIFKKIKPGPTAFKSNYRFLTVFSVCFFIIMGVVVGTNAFNLGTISRYRVPALPFLFAGILSWKLIKKKRKADNLNKNDVTALPDFKEEL